MSGKNPHHRPALAAVVASFVMLLFGWVYRTLATQLEGPLTTTVIAPDALEGVPIRIADWVGEDLPLDEAIVTRTNTDTHINRRYSRGLESVSLYIGCGVRTRDLIMHRPDTCYIGAGWTRTGRSLRELPLCTGSILPCTVFEFSRGALNTTDKIMVLHYYIVDGHYCQSVSEWRYAFWRIGYVAQVQVVASLEALATDEATRIVSEFAAESAPQIRGLFDRVENGRSETSSDELPIEK
jgi:hypothetical protein